MSLSIFFIMTHLTDKCDLMVQALQLEEELQAQADLQILDDAEEFWANFDQEEFFADPAEMAAINAPNAPWLPNFHLLSDENLDDLPTTEELTDVSDVEMEVYDLDTDVDLE